MQGIRRVCSAMSNVLKLAIFALGWACVCAASANAAQPSDVCARPSAGSSVVPPPDLFSRNGVLAATVDYVTSMDDASRTLFCFRTCFPATRLI